MGAIAFALAKLFLYWAACYKVGRWVCEWYLGRKYTWIPVKEFCASGIMNFVNEVRFKTYKAFVKEFVIIEPLKETVTFTTSGRKAAVARALGKSVYMFDFQRGDKETIFRSISLSNPSTGYNFLKNQFTALCGNRYFYVQYHKSNELTRG